MSKNLLLRLSSSIILLPIVLSAMFAGGMVFAVFTYGAILLGTLEYAMMTSGNRWNASVILSAVMALALSVSISSQSALLIALSLIFGTAALGISALMGAPYEADRGSPKQQFIPLLLLTLYMGVVGGVSVLIRLQEAGLLWWLLIISGTWSMDTFSYVGGRAYGKHPLAPQVSPSKTREGALTGIVGSLVISLLILLQLQSLMPVSVAIALGAPFFALIGDLLESSVKRHFHVKDSHFKGFNVIPGHGGVLDRIDSMMMVVIYCFVIVSLFSLM